MSNIENNVKQNILNKLATFNCLWTLAAISAEEYNSGSYREGPNSLDKVVFSSAGRYADARVPTVDGVPEFFINNMEITAFTSPTGAAGNTNQQTLKYELFEPYSMGLFLQSLQTAAKLANYNSYMQDAPYVLRLDIEGQSTTNSFTSIGPWYFCVRIQEISWTADESGSKYNVIMFPYNDQVFNKSSNTLFNDVKIIGKGAYEALVGHPTNSLLVMLNNREQELVKTGVKLIADKYEIQFPDCDWGEPNPFKADNDTASFEFQADSSGIIGIYKRNGDVIDGTKVVRDRMTIDPRETSMMLSKDTSITNAIDLVLTNTKHVRETAMGQKEFENGNVIWWKLLPEIVIGDNDKSQNSRAKTYIYKIVPYKVHHSIFKPTQVAPQAIDQLKSDVTKKYYYMYSGLNTEVLKWELLFKTLHVTGVAPNPTNNSGTNVNSGINASVSAPIYGSKTSAGEGVETSPASVAPNVKITNAVTNNAIAGGSGRLDTAQQVANQFYANILRINGDMQELNLDIMGDPYWLPVAGHPNYTPSGNGGMENEDQTMNFTNREICIQMDFKSPQDTVGGDGFYKFQDAGISGPFSGIYRINKVLSKWNDGNFTQTLSGNMIPGQDLKENPTDEVSVTTLDKPIPERSTLFSSKYYG